MKKWIWLGAYLALALVNVALGVYAVVRGASGWSLVSFVAALFIAYLGWGLYRRFAWIEVARTNIDEFDRLFQSERYYDACRSALDGDDKEFVAFNETLDELLVSIPPSPNPWKPWERA